MMQCLVVGYALQPCSQGCPLRIKALAVLVGGNKRVLHHVLGILLLYDDAPHECHQRRAIVSDQQAKVFVAAVSHELYEHLLVVRHSIYI